jgi:YidC/Oxa1 family membrane protein insertase
MEKRLILAIVLSFIVLVGYQLLVVKPKAQIMPPAQTMEEPLTLPQAPALKKTAEKTPPEAVETPQPAAAQESTPVEAASEAVVTVDTPLYRAVWSNRGAVLISWTLKQHTDNAGKALELIPLAAKDLGVYPFSMGADDPGLTEVLNSALYAPSRSALEVDSGGAAELRFEYSDGKSVRAVKKLGFRGDSYALDTDIRVWKNGEEISPSVIWGPGLGNRSPEEMKKSFRAVSGIAVYTGGKVHRMDEKKYKQETSAYNFVDWAAYEDNYFTALFILSPRQGQAMFIRETPDEVPVHFLNVSPPQTVFIGPKDFDALKAFGHDARRVINFGFFGSIAEILLLGVKFFHKSIPNWGVAIILLTIVIKIIFFPLTYSQTKSMSRMAEIQPKMKAIKAKFKKSKTDIAQRRQMNEEMMRLYKEHGVNPAGGCLPMLVQIPVFWGFFRMLTVAVEFRHSPFIFWIKDLSVHDPIYVTPILMGITQFISQKMTPSSADPSQARMMLLMPVIMTVFFMNFQSGLVLYWLTMNVLQIGQQMIMNRMMERHKRDRDGKRK